MAKLCPLIKKECMGHNCEWYIHLQGTHPQSGEVQDEWGCSIAWLPILLVENAKESRQAAASTDKVHNLFAGLAKRAMIGQALNGTDPKSNL